jgi:hypothetical protein
VNGYPVTWTCYERAEGRSQWYLWINAARLWFAYCQEGYTCCVVDQDRPTLTTSALHLDAWLEAGEQRFSRRLNWCELDPEICPVVTKVSLDISSRLTVTELHLRGVAELDKLRTLLDGLAVWLRESCKPDELVTPHEGVLSD